MKKGRENIVQGTEKKPNFVVVALVLRVPVDQLANLYDSVESQDVEIVFRKVSSGKLYITGHPPENGR